MKSNSEIVRAWIDAFNRHDVHAVVDAFHRDGELLVVPMGERFNEPEGLRKYFADFFTAFPDVTVVVGKMVETGDDVAVEWVCTGTLQSEYMTFPPTNKAFELPGSCFFTMKKGKIAVKKSYWDKISLFAQLMTL